MPTNLIIFPPSIRRVSVSEKVSVMIQRLFFIMAVVVVIAWCVPAVAGWLPERWEAFYFTPGRRSTLRLKNPEAPPGTKVSYQIRNYTDHVVATGEEEVDANNRISIPIQLPNGFYEIHLNGQESVIRLFGANEFSAAPDPFFGIDAGYSWFPGGEKESAMMEALRRHGIHTVRERLSYREIQDDLDSGKSWKEGNAERYRSVRHRLKQHRLKVLDCFHDAPASRGGNPSAHDGNNYPADLLAVSRDWCDFFRQFDGLDDCMEIWNEPDGFCRSPATLYVPLVKTLAWSHAQSGTGMTLAGGVFSELAPKEFLETAAEDGLFDFVDAVSYHTYSGPVEVEKQIRFYRDLFRKYGREGMPLLITEGGRPFSQNVWWDQGNSASWIVAKGIVARACGLAGYYPFFAQCYAENWSGSGTLNFSMLDSNSAPLRSMAAYFQMAAELSNLEYLGDLDCQDPKVIACPVFGDEKRMVAALITLAVQAENTVNFPYPVSSVRGIDGRKLVPIKKGVLPVPDGVTYLELSSRQVKSTPGILNRQTRFMELYKRAKTPLPPKKTIPVVLSFQPEKKQLFQLDGFHPAPEEWKDYSFRVNCFNLSDSEMKGEIHVTPPLRVSQADTLIRTVVLPPRSVQTETFRLDLSGSVGMSGSLKIEFHDAVGLVDRISPRLIGARELKTMRILSRGSRVKVDGVISTDEWGVGEPEKLGNDDYNVKARFAWSPAGFYFAFEVHDSEHLQKAGPGNAWQEDSIQLAFAASEKEQQYEFGISLAGDTARWSRWIAPAGAKPLNEKMPLRIVRDDDNKTTVYEGMIPWGELIPLKGEPNKSFRFTFCVHNLFPNGEKRTLEWTPGIASGGKLPALFGVVQLYDYSE